MFLSISLLLVSALSGVGLIWLFSKCSNQRAIKATKKRLQARLLELRLYADDPRVVLRAQRALLIENAKYFALMLRPAVIATLPMILLLIVMDGFYGKRAFLPGEPVTLTARLSDAASEDIGVAIQAPAAFAVESPGIRAIEDREVSWRLRPTAPASGEIEVTIGGEETSKRIAAGEGFRYLVNRRVRSIASWLLYPGEAPISSGPVEWIEVDYPAAEVSYFGLRTHWLVWFVIFSMATAFLLKDRFGVTV